MLPDALDLLRCPRTGARLRQDGPERLVSETGSHAYQVVAGIPDFRLADPPYVSRTEERRRVEEILAASSGMRYDDLIVHYETKILRHQAIREARKSIEHRLALRTRAKRRFRQLVQQAACRPEETMCQRVLDLGCGSGEAISELRQFTAGTVFGIDISLEELVLAQALLREEGAEARLVAGGAEALPFADGIFGFVYSPDVIEHVNDQREYLQEAHRVLEDGGSILFNSPNRYNLITAEPHNGIWAFGFLPRATMDRASRLLGRGRYIGKRLVSLPELRRLSSACFAEHAIRSRESNPVATSVAGRLYHATSPFSVRLFAYVTDMHVVIARKKLKSGLGR